MPGVDIGVRGFVGGSSGGGRALWWGRAGLGGARGLWCLLLRFLIS